MRVSKFRNMHVYIMYLHTCTYICIHVCISGVHLSLRKRIDLVHARRESKKDGGGRVGHMFMRRGERKKKRAQRRSKTRSSRLVKSATTKCGAAQKEALDIVASYEKRMVLFVPVPFISSLFSSLLLPLSNKSNVFTSACARKCTRIRATPLYRRRIYTRARSTMHRVYSPYNRGYIHFRPRFTHKYIHARARARQHSGSFFSSPHLSSILKHLISRGELMLRGCRISFGRSVGRISVYTNPPRRASASKSKSRAARLPYCY